MVTKLKRKSGHRTGRGDSRTAGRGRAVPGLAIRPPSNHAVPLLIVALLTFQPTPAASQDRVKVVTTLTTYASLAREVGGDLVEVEAIARGDVDPHFVNPRPSFAAKIQRADLFVSTGLDLELWVPALLDRANNQRVVDGADGFVAAYAGVELRDVPASVSRTGGDVHVFGNPHVHTDPINTIIVAGNIAAGLRRVDPSNSSAYDANLQSFRDRIITRLYGERLVELLGAETLFDLGRSNSFWDFAAAQTYQGRPLTEYVGGWLGAAAPFRGRDIVCYHKNWAYFESRFQVRCAMYVEPLPGIPASPGHVREVIDFIRQNDIAAIFTANHFSRTQVERVASRTATSAVIVPLHERGVEGVNTYFALVDMWVNMLASAFDAGTIHP